MLNTETTAHIIQLLWLVWALCWLAASWRNKKTRNIEPFRTRIRYQLVTAAGLALMFVGLPPIESADSDLFARGLTLNIVCIAVVAAGLGWALYARHHLGRNWSGTVQLKEGHSLIRTGPYRFTRHPIYTGLLLGFVGLGAFLDRWLELPGIALVILGFCMKMTREERVMGAQFGQDYANYSQQVKRLIPFIW